MLEYGGDNMGVLDTVIQFKRDEEQRKMADIMAVPTAIQGFLQANQQKTLNDLAIKKTNAEIDNLVSQINNRGQPDIMSLVRDVKDLADLSRETNSVEGALLAKNAASKVFDMIRPHSVKEYLNPVAASATPDIKLQDPREQDLLGEFEGLLDIAGEKDVVYNKATPRAELAMEQAKNQLEVQKGVEKTTAEKAAGAERSLKSTRLFIRGLEKSQAELEGRFPDIGKAGLSGKIERTKAGIANMMDELPETSAFMKNKRAAANKMARDIEGGRVTDQDRAVYADTLASAIDNPNSENVSLVAKQLLGFWGDGADIKPTIDLYKSSNVKLLNDIARETENEINALSGNDSKEFDQNTFSESLKNMSTEELRKLLGE